MKVDSYFTTELVRPWKLAALAWGISILWLGMKLEPAPDWTWSTILWMAAGTAVLAPWSVDVFMRLRWKLMPAALFAGWLVCDGLWVVGVVLGDNTAAAWSMREGQWLCSLCLFLLYGIALRPKASLADMLREISTSLHLRPRKEGVR